MDFKIAHNIQEKQRTEDIEIDETVTFEEMFLSEAVLNGLHACGYVQPSPIQLKAIPLGRCGLDLIVQAKSGTGKTCVFSVVALEMISVKAKTTQVLVIAPTREIAVQIGQVINSIGSSLPELKAYTFIGGINLMDDKAKLSCCHIAIGTPGRLTQLVSLGNLNLTNVRLLVLDEADQLLTGQFKSSILELVKTSPFNKQILACSATYPREVTEFLDQYMRSPSHVRLGKDSPALIGVKQFARLLPDHPHSHTRHKLKFRELLSILSSISFNQCLVFSNSQLRAESICNQLKSSGWPAAFLTGGQLQSERLQSYFALCSYKCRILVSTDLSARGLDSEHVNLVINLDIPMDQATYLHRIGRAGRFGSVGIAISLACEGAEWEAMRAVVNMTNVTIKVLPETFDTDYIQNNYESFEIIEKLEEENFSQFFEKISKKKFKLNSVNTEPSVNILKEKSKMLVKEKENKLSKHLKIEKRSNEITNKSISNESEKEEDDLCIKTIKEAIHDYTNETMFISFSHKKLEGKISEDLENLLLLDIPHLAAEGLVKMYPSASSFTALESYIMNRERNLNTSNNVLDSVHALKNSEKDSSLKSIKSNKKECNLKNNPTSTIMHEQNGKNTSNCTDINEKLDNGSIYSLESVSTSIVDHCVGKNFDIDNKSETKVENKFKETSISSLEEVKVKLEVRPKMKTSLKKENYNENDINEKFHNISISTVGNVYNSILDNCVDKNFDIDYKSETEIENKFKETSISGLEETKVKLGAIPKMRASSLKKQNYNENTGYGVWQPVTTSTKKSNGKSISQFPSASGSSSVDKNNFENKHYSTNNSDANEDLLSKNHFNNHVGNEWNVNSYPSPYNAKSYFFSNYNQYCASINMYVESAQKFAYMMEYTQSLGKMSAWIAQDNDRRYLDKNQQKKSSKQKN